MTATCARYEWYAPSFLSSSTRLPAGALRVLIIVFQQDGGPLSRPGRQPAVCTLFTPPRVRVSLPAPALHGADDAVAVDRRPDEVSAGELHLVKGKVR